MPETLTNKKPARAHSAPIDAATVVFVVYIAFVLVVQYNSLGSSMGSIDYILFAVPIGYLVPVILDFFRGR
jgi:uncharacterized membrane protein (DUF485 family)